MDKMEECFICIAGKNDIAVDVLTYLVDEYSFSRLGVVCNRNETGKNSFQKSLRWFAERYGVHEYQLEDLYGIENLIFLSLEFDRILRPARFKEARLYNIHFSLLPKYKGAHTAAMPILNGDTKTGVTLHCIDAGIDTGEVIAQRSFQIDQMDCREVYLSCMKAGTELVLENLDRIIEHKEESHPQPVVGSTYNAKGKIDYSNPEIDLHQTAECVSRQVRAYSFREFQLPRMNGKNIIDYIFTADRSCERPGTILLDTEAACRVATIDYDIILQYDRLKELLECCKVGDLSRVENICVSKKHLNSYDEHGWTPLIVSTFYGQVDVVKFLILQGADIGAADHNGATLLMYAEEAGLHTGDWSLFRLYVRLGADIYRKDYKNRSVLDVCKDRSSINKIPEDVRNIILGGGGNNNSRGVMRPAFFVRYDLAERRWDA